MRRSTILTLLLLVVIAQPCLSGWEVTRVHPAGADWSQLMGISGRYAVGEIAYTNGPPNVTVQAGLYDMMSGTWKSLDTRDTTANAVSDRWAGGFLYQPGNASVVKATAWSLSGGSARDLQPAGALTSVVVAASGQLLAGSAQFSGKIHAFVWDMGSGQQYDLHPPAAVSGSSVSGLDGNRAAGTVGLGGGVTHAVLWNDVAEGSYVDLDLGSLPYRGSGANAISGDSQVGYLGTSAALWRGSAESYVALHPAWIPTAYYSIAYGVSQNVQVGVVVYGIAHAAVWFGSAESFFDLHSLLDPSHYRDSVANDVWVDEIGNIYVVGYGAVVNGGPAEALLWTYVVPEPGSLAALALGLAGLMARRREKPR